MGPLGGQSSAPRRFAESPTPARSPTEEFYQEEMREAENQAEEVERMAAAEEEQRRALNAPLVAHVATDDEPRSEEPPVVLDALQVARMVPDNEEEGFEEESESDASPLTLEEQRALMDEAITRARRMLCDVSVSVEAGTEPPPSFKPLETESWGTWTAGPTRKELFLKWEAAVYADAGQYDVWESHHRMGEPIPLCRDCLGHPINMLSRVAHDPDYLPKYCTGGGLPAMDLEPDQVECVPVCPGYVSMNSCSWAHGIIPPERCYILQEPKDLERYFGPKRFAEVEILTTELLDAHYKILDDLNEAESLRGFGVTEEMVNKALEEVSSSLTSGASFHPHVRPNSNVHTLIYKYLLRAARVLRVHSLHSHQYYDIEATLLEPPDGVQGWHVDVCWDLLGRQLRSRALEFHKMAEDRRAKRAQRPKARPAPPQLEEDPTSEEEEDVDSSILKEYTELGWYVQKVLEEIRGGNLAPSPKIYLEGQMVNAPSTHGGTQRPAEPPSPAMVPPEPPSPSGVLAPPEPPSPAESMAPPLPPPVPRFKMPQRPPRPLSGEGNYSVWDLLNTPVEPPSPMSPVPTEVSDRGRSRSPRRLRHSDVVSDARAAISEAEAALR